MVFELLLYTLFFVTRLLKGTTLNTFAAYKRAFRLTVPISLPDKSVTAVNLKENATSAISCL